jgi:hypothetical protein
MKFSIFFFFLNKTCLLSFTLEKFENCRAYLEIVRAATHYQVDLTGLPDS